MAAVKHVTSSEVVLSWSIPPVPTTSEPHKKQLSGGNYSPICALPNTVSSRFPEVRHIERRKMAAERSRIRESKRVSTCEKQRPLMLKDFLNDTSSIHVSKHRQYLRRNSKESPTTVKYLLGMELKSKKKALQGIGIVSFKHSSSTRSALHRASEVLVKLLPFPIRAPSKQRHGTTMPRRHSINKLDSFPHRLPSARECRARPDGSLSRRLTAALRSISRRRHCNKKRAEIQIRVRDIVRWASFGDGEITSCECSNPETPPREEAHARTHDATSDSLSPSRTSSYTWSDFGPEGDCASTLQSSRGSSVCCSEADVMKDKMLLLNYHGKGEELEEAVVDGILEGGSPMTDTPIRLLACDNAGGLAWSEGGSDSLDTCSANEQEADIQRLEHGNDGRKVRSNSEGHEKELLSPISVLDFSFEDEVTAASFEEGLANARGTKRQLLLKISWTGILSQLDPVELQKHLASSEFEILNEGSESFINYHDSNNGHELNDVKTEDVEECVREILSEFLDAPTKRQWRSFELLVLDILREELSIVSELDENELVKIASGRILKEWLLMENQMDESSELSVKEMEVNQDWMKFTTDEEEMVMELEATVLRSLIHELFLDLID